MAPVLGLYFPGIWAPPKSSQKQYNVVRTQGLLSLDSVHPDALFSLYHRWMRSSEFILLLDILHLIWCFSIPSMLHQTVIFCSSSCTVPIVYLHPNFLSIKLSFNVWIISLFLAVYHVLQWNYVRICLLKLIFLHLGDLAKLESWVIQKLSFNIFIEI